MENNCVTEVVSKREAIMPPTQQDSREAKRRKTGNVPFAASSWWKFGTLPKEELSKLGTKSTASDSSDPVASNSAFRKSKTDAKARDVHETAALPRMVTEDDLLHPLGIPKVSSTLNCLFPDHPQASQANSHILMRTAHREFSSMMNQNVSVGESPLVTWLGNELRADQSAVSIAAAPSAFTHPSAIHSVIFEQRKKFLHEAALAKALQKQQREAAKAANDSDDSSSNTSGDVKFRAYQAENWTEKFGKYVLLLLFRLPQHAKLSVQVSHTPWHHLIVFVFCSQTNSSSFAKRTAIVWFPTSIHRIPAWPNGLNVSGINSNCARMGSDPLSRMNESVLWIR
jgi:hypothetical protein